MNQLPFPLLPFLLISWRTHPLAFARESPLDLASLCTHRWWPTYSLQSHFNCWDKFLFDLRQAFSSSFKIMPLTRDDSFHLFGAWAHYCCPIKPLKTLLWSCSSFRAFLVSRSKASAVAILTSLSSSYSFQTLMAMDLNFSSTTQALSSSAFRACTSSLSSEALTSSSLTVFRFGSQSNPCVRTLSHLW